MRDQSQRWAVIEEDISYLCLLISVHGQQYKYIYNSKKEQINRLKTLCLHNGILHDGDTNQKI